MISSSPARIILGAIAYSCVNKGLLVGSVAWVRQRLATYQYMVIIVSKCLCLIDSRV